MYLSRLICQNNRIKIRITRAKKKKQDQKSLHCKFTVQYIQSLWVCYSQTGWNHLSQQHVFLTAHSSERSAERLRYRHAAPVSFVVQALANPIRMIRQSGKLIDVVKSDTDDDSLLMPLAGMFDDPCNPIWGTNEREISPCTPTLMYSSLNKSVL